MNYDIIGDIHGHAVELVALLGKLGYRKNGRVWRQDGHTAIFVGDFIDRGVGQLETLDIVRPMIDQHTALAVMGNHEFNAIAWHSPPEKTCGGLMRMNIEALRYFLRSPPAQDIGRLRTWCGRASAT